MEPRIARRPRAYVGAVGPDAADFLERMLSNDVAGLAPGEARDALLLTPKGRIIAPVRVLRRGDGDFLLLTEPELGERLREELLRMRFAAKVAIEAEEHRSWVLLGEGNGGIPTADYGVAASEVLDEEPQAAAEVGDAELEALRIEAGTPAWGKEVDETILPAEAGLDQTHISFTKGCFPGQEPVARLHYRGHPNRRLRALEVEGVEPGDELVWDGKTVGRVTSAVAGRALGYVRTEVPGGAELELAGRPGVHARMRPA